MALDSLPGKSPRCVKPGGSPHGNAGGGTFVLLSTVPGERLWALELPREYTAQPSVERTFPP